MLNDSIHKKVNYFKRKISKCAVEGDEKQFDFFIKDRQKWLDNMIKKEDPETIKALLNHIVESDLEVEEVLTKQMELSKSEIIKADFQEKTRKKLKIYE